MIRFRLKIALVSAVVLSGCGPKTVVPNADNPLQCGVAFATTADLAADTPVKTGEMLKTRDRLVSTMHIFMKLAADDVKKNPSAFGSKQDALAVRQTILKDDAGAHAFVKDCIGKTAERHRDEISLYNRLSKK